MKQTDIPVPPPAQPDSIATSSASAPPAAAAVPQHAAVPANERTTPAPTLTSEIPPTLLRPKDTIVVDTQQTDTVKFLTCWFDTADIPFEIREVQQRESMFAANKQSRSEAQPIARPGDIADGWIFGAIVLLTVFISLYLNNQKFKLKDIFRSLFDLRALDRVFRESNIKPLSLLPMTGIYLSSIALTALQATRQYGVYLDGMPEVVLFLIMMGGLMLFILLKTGFIQMIGGLFENSTATALLNSSNFLFYFVGGILLTPLLLFVFYTPSAQGIPLKIALGVILILFLVRFLRGMQLILTNSKSSRLYLFYYLCIFEIVPILILTKVLLS